MAMCYGDLNGDAGLGELDSGTDSTARRRRLQSRCGWSRILTKVACKSVGCGRPWPRAFASAKFDTAPMVKTAEVSDELLISDAARPVARGCAALERRSR